MKATSLPVVLLLVFASFAESVLSAPPAVQVYQGLSYTETEPPEPFGAIAVSIRSSGLFSASYRSGGQKVAFQGVLEPDSTGVAEKNGVELSFVLDPETNELTGTLTSEFEESLVIRAVAKASPDEMAERGFAGKYTLRFSDGVLPEQGAFGHGFATLTVSASGSIRMAGRLADGARFTFNSAVGADGTFPLDVTMHKGWSAARGWLTVVGSSEAVPDESDLSGQVLWHSDLTTVVKGRNFFTAFETLLTVDGSRYTPPANGASLLDLSTPLVRLSAGDLRRPLNREISILGAKISTNWKTTRFSLSATPGSGALSGKFFHPASGTKRPFHGVVLQKQNVAAGFFLGTNVGGRMSLAEKDIRSIGFDNPESDVIAILPAEEEGDPSIVILRDENPDVAYRVVLILADSSVIEMVSDSNERLAELTIGAHRFVYSNYTATTVNRTHYAPDGSVTAETVTFSEGAMSQALPQAEPRSLSSGPARKMARSQAMAEVDDETIEESVFKNLDWLTRDIEEVVPEIAKEILAKQVDRVRNSRVGKWVRYGYAIGEALVDYITASRLEIPPEVDDSEQWVARAEGAETLMNELPRVDPDGVADAGLYATEDGIHPQRDEWDRLARNRQIDTSFDLADSPPEQSVFAQMNPDSPSYVAPAPLTAQNLLLSTPKDTAVSGVFGGTSMDYFRIVRRPSDGTVTLIDIVAGTFSYQPKQGYRGIDQFSYVAVNKDDKSAPAVVTIEVGGGALAAHDMILETDRDTEISQQLSGSGAEFFGVFKQPKHGTLTLTDPISGAFTYQPNPGYTGTDTFSFFAFREGDRSKEGVVTIQVKKGPETANEWEKILLGKWRVVEHPQLEEETHNSSYGIHENWTVEFTKDFNSRGLRVTHQYVQFFEYFDRDGPKRNPVRDSAFYPHFLFGQHHWYGYRNGDGTTTLPPATWMLSYNGIKENGNNIALISYSGGKLTVVFGDYQMHQPKLSWGLEGLDKYYLTVATLVKE
jgi:hypothetical protein